MFKTASSIAAPLAAIAFLAAASVSSSAAASPGHTKLLGQDVASERIVQVDHRHGGRGWRGERHWYGHKMKPRQIRRSLRHQGYYRIKILDKRGPVYIVKARGWRGMPMRLVVDSRTAQVVRSRPIGQGYYRTYGW
ncbi:hypothetical protein E1180_15075 [Roseibium denhamense]|uniref:Antifreeze protein n=1 Tax=Roseibium denhamense TaxID=76305 RepID=A0ABY1NK61_9HYPH|nr:hypothetical protein [Roseibium denhamense]MTI06835.1 hypothetical protein [Roseibium denhamense]SMP11847.1 hypothetical protein SAMN06265374_1364 [Roseibium denhamense]